MTGNTDDMSAERIARIRSEMQIDHFSFALIFGTTMVEAQDWEKGELLPSPRQVFMLQHAERALEQGCIAFEVSEQSAAVEVLGWLLWKGARRRHAERVRPPEVTR